MRLAARYLSSTYFSVLTDPGLVVEEDKAAAFVGTPGYVPAENCSAADGDIYSLGLTLKAASFGRRLEDLAKGPALEADTGAKFFPAWWRILNKATDDDPRRRHQSAKALLKELKGLRIKMACARFSGTYKAAIGVLLLAAVAYAYVSYRERKRLEAEIEPMKRIISIAQSLNDMSAQDDTAWSSFSGSYFCRTDESHRQRLRRAVEKDPDRAGAMRDILEKMQEIDKKGEENNRRIKALRDQNRNKGEAGKGASERYNQAEMLSLENEKLVKAWLALLERFTVIEDEIKLNQ